MQNRKPEKLNSSTNCQTGTGSDQFTVADLTYHAAHKQRASTGTVSRGASRCEKAAAEAPGRIGRKVA
jgi:hypothetical protein